MMFSKLMFQSRPSGGQTTLISMALIRTLTAINKSSNDLAFMPPGTQPGAPLLGSFQGQDIPPARKRHKKSPAAVSRTRL
jgi:hypothetical protein